MSNGVFTYARGSFVRYSQLPVGTDSLLLVLLKSTGLVADTTMRNYQTLAAVLAGASDEADCTNYVRKSITTGITITPDTTNSKMSADMGDITWTALGGAVNNVLGKMLICYRLTSSTADSAILPLTYHDFTATTTGVDVLAQLATAGYGVAA